MRRSKLLTLCAAVGVLAVTITGCGCATVNVDTSDINVNVGGIAEETEKEEKDLESFETANINLECADVSVVKGDAYHISISRSENYEILSDVKDGVLTVNSNGDDKNNVSATIVITVPNEATIKTMTSELGVGSVTVNGMSLDELSVKTGVGSVDMENCEIAKADIEVATGSVDIYDSNYSSNTAFDLTADLGSIGLNGNNVSSPYKGGSGDKTLKATVSVGDITIEQQ